MSIITIYKMIYILIKKIGTKKFNIVCFLREIQSKMAAIIADTYKSPKNTFLNTQNNSCNTNHFCVTSQKIERIRIYFGVISFNNWHRSWGTSTISSGIHLTFGCLWLFSPITYRWIGVQEPTRLNEFNAIIIRNFVFFILQLDLVVPNIFLPTRNVWC